MAVRFRQIPSDEIRRTRSPSSFALYRVRQHGLIGTAQVRFLQSPNEETEVQNMGIKVVYYRFTVLRTWKRYEDIVSWDTYLDLLDDDDVIVKFHQNVRV